ncbi:MAG: hypothetical protein EBV31_08395, partial [Verrucomicrobia bacterium]|nr:hypothetical protein [Verrucomicrobiota bacterium]
MTISVDDDHARRRGFQRRGRIPSLQRYDRDDREPGGGMQRAVGVLGAREEVARDRAEEGEGRAERGRHDHADDAFHHHRAEDEDDAADEGHRRGDGLAEAAAGPADDHAAADAGREGEAGEDRQAEVTAGLLEAERELSELVQVIEAPGERHAEHDRQQERHDEPSGDVRRRHGILFRLVAGRGEPERQAGAEEGDMDQQA